MSTRRKRFERLESERVAPPALRPPPLEGRFRPAPPAEGLRVLELGQGQSFQRCAGCRRDHHATAVRCTECGADLTTREQRAFNEAFWKQRMAEDAEYEREVERARAARAEGERESAAALRQREAWERELTVRRARRELDADHPRLLVEEAAVRVGRSIGRWLRRLLARRR